MNRQGRTRGAYGGRSVVVALFVMLLPVNAAQAIEGLERNVAVLRWLDKTTARAETLEVPVNETVRIESLELIVRACVQRPPEEPPESAAFLDVSEIRPGGPTNDVFRGWMFASSPALSAMEHPVYDIWVLGCKATGNGSVKKRRKNGP